MIVSDEKIERLFVRVQELKSHLGCDVLLGLPIPVSVEDVQKAVEDMQGVRVEKHVVLTSGSHLHSMLARKNDGTCLILLREGLTEYQQRFAAFKELSHIFLDERSDWSTRVVETIQGLTEFEILERARNGEHEPENTVILAEHLAEIAATELLYPPERRVNDRAELDRQETTYRKLCARYLAPVRNVRFVHMRWYQGMSEAYGPVAKQAKPPISEG